MKRLTHLSLFSGIGGIDLAAEAAGFETVCQCEKATFPLLVLKKHWPDVPHFGDIKEITKEAFIEKTGIERPTLITGGFPCQPFSQAGTRRGFADERYLWPEMFRVICELRPRWVIGENVAGFARMGLDQTLSDLESERYCARTFLIPACSVGAWHERKRTFIVSADVSDTACLRHGYWNGKAGALCDEWRSDTQENTKQQGMDTEAIGRGVFSHTDGLGRPALSAWDKSSERCETYGELVGANCPHGKPHTGKSRTQSVLGGVADGLSAWMDGHRLWEREPESVPRMSEVSKNGAARLCALGNAVVPQQVYPILKYIADIETGGDES